MLTRLLLLAVTWLVIANLALMLASIRLRRASILLSLAWLVAAILLGDIIALATFGVLSEVSLLSLAALVFGAFLATRLRDWNAFGHVAWTMTLVATALFLAYTFSLTVFSPLNPLSYLLAFVFFAIEVVALMLALTHAYEGYDRASRVIWRRRGGSSPSQPGFHPKVSLHVPTYNEPLEVVQKTLQALARLDYPDYEVLVVDNNTPEESTWKALEKLSQDLGPRFRFLHLEDWPGFKSGALNFALAQTAPEAEIIGIIDADYVVAPDFLKDLVPSFTNPQVAFVQTPQDYRDVGNAPFLQAIYHGYRYFFEVSMPVRNESNAIIFCGTMGLLRKRVLQEIGGWDEWCITEDAEASLRILKRGYQSIYLNKTYGRGLLPYTFDSLKKQRFRWAFGGIQLLRKHWESLMPWAKIVEPENRLTGSQKYYYLASGLQWFTDLLNLLFAIFLVLGGLILLITGRFAIRPLTVPIIVMPVIFLLLNVGRFVWLLRRCLRLPWGKALQTMYGFFSLSWVVTLATIQGLVQRHGIFLRTPKAKSNSKVTQALAAARWETILGLAILVIGVAVMLVRPNPSSGLMALMLGWQSSIYLSAPWLSLSAARSNLPAYLRGGQEGAPLWESRAARGAAAVALVAVLIAGLVQGLPQPASTSYSQYQPAEVTVQDLVRNKGKPPKVKPDKGNGKGNQDKGKPADNNPNKGGNGNQGKGKP